MSTIDTDRFTSLEIAPTPTTPVAKKRKLADIVSAAPKEINKEAFSSSNKAEGPTKGNLPAPKGKAKQDANGTWKNALGLESTEAHRHVSKVWQDECLPFGDLQQTVTEQQVGKRDLIVPRSEVRVAPSNDGLSLVTSKDLPTLPAGALLLKTGVAGLTDFTDIPTEIVKYMLRKEKAGDLAGYVNQELGKHKEGDHFTVRVRNHLGSDVVRHVASQGYAPINNIDAVRIVSKAFEGNDIGDLLVSHASNNSDELYCNLLVPDRMKAMPDSDYGVGIAFMNSEVGTRSFGFSPFLFRAICLNGCIWGRMDAAQSLRVKQRHWGVLNEDELTDMVVKSLDAALTAGWSMLDVMQSTRSAKIRSVRGTIAHLARTHKVPKPVSSAWYQSFLAEPEPTGFGIVQGLTLAAQSFSGDQRYQMESLAGTILAPSLEADLRTILSHWGNIDHSGAALPEKVVEQYVGVQVK